MNYADIKKIDVANGEGVRVSVFVSGCNHHCKGCFNQCAWDFNYGKEFSEKEEQQIIDYMNHDYISGLSLLGGEPLEPRNQEGLLPLVKKVKKKFPNKNIWCYTGFDFEKDVVGKMAKDNETTRELLKYIDVIVDGKFEEDKRDAIAAGMNGHIAKPIQVDKLLSILSEVIRKQSLYRLKNGTMGKTDDVFADNVIY